MNGEREWEKIFFANVCRGEGGGDSVLHVVRVASTLTCRDDEGRKTADGQSHIPHCRNDTGWGASHSTCSLFFGNKTGKIKGLVSPEG
jgi:hypothetical protein